jgi:hypothetical protein
MALGTVTDSSDGLRRSIELLASAVAANSPPASAGAGIATQDIFNAFGRVPSCMELVLYSTAGSGTMSVSARLWVYSESASKWLPLGSGSDSTKGMLNEGNSIGESTADGLLHCETVANLGNFARIYLELTAISGTSTAVTAKLVAARS